MNLNKRVSTLTGLVIIVIAAVILIGGALIYQYFELQKINNYIQTMGQTAEWKLYKNSVYGFQIIFPDSWKGYMVENKNWQGNLVDNFEHKYSGPEIIFKNPQTTPQQAWQDIPIMVFTPDVWQLIQEEKIAVSAAPIGPAKVGENAKYVFATPPRWYGFTDAIGFQEAVEIVKTFKAF